MTCVYEENIHTLDIQFPKVTQNNVCKVIAFGDWCKSDNGGNTLKRLAEYAKDTDAVVFLGDIAYENSLAQSLMNSTGAILTDAGKPLNDAQNTALGFAERTLQSNSIFDSIGSKFTGVKSYVGQMLPNFLKTDDRQKFEQAERNFINAVLRRESGAVISPEEFANAREQYFPRVGDGAEVLAQKAQNRETTIKGLYQSAGVAGQMQGSLNVAKLSNDELLDSIVEENVAGQSNEDFFNSMVNSLQK